MTSTQAGLQGIELGTQLIKHAVIRLQAEFPNMTTFSTLSPIPGFRSWLLMELARAETQLLTENEISLLQSFLNSNADSAVSQFGAWIKDNSWSSIPDLAAVLKPVLLRLCARYLCKEKRRNFALNSVANFHVRNGACLWRINWMADTSRRGMTNSCGIMVNYRYFLDKLETNSNNYLSNYVMDTDKQVLELL